MSSTTMRKMELLLLKSDIDGTLRYLSSGHSFQIIYPDEDGSSRARGDSQATGRRARVSGTDAGEEAFLARLDAAMAKLGKIGACLGYQEASLDLGKAKLPDEALLSEVDRLASFCGENEEAALAQKRKLDELEESLREVKAFAGLSLPFEDINKLAFVALRIGKVNPDRIPLLAGALDARAAIIPLDDEGSIIAVASRRGRFALETELAKAGFVKADLPPDFKGVPANALAAIEASYEVAKKRLAALAEMKEEEARRFAASWAEMLSSVKLGRALKKVESRLEGTEWVYRLSGWVPAQNVKPLSDDLARLFGDRMAIRVYNPEDEKGKLPEDSQEVPVLLKHNGLVSAFQGIVLSYGTPVYGDIDPTPFVAFFFTLLFAIMFGDMGQGAVIICAGLLIRRAKKGFFAGYQKFWLAFVAAGAGSMFMGLLVGSVFSNEELLVPVERFLTALILGSPRDRFLDIMPSDNISAMFSFFGFTVGIGFLINSTGLVINMINLARRGEWGEALFAKTGLSGSLLFWWAAGMGVRIILGGKLGWIDILGLGIPLAALLFTEPLQRAAMKAGRKKHAKVTEGDGEGEGAAEARAEKLSVVDVLVGGLVEIIETFSYYASNTMSFLRVAAFALAHAVLSFVVFTMAELVRNRAPGGVVFQLVVFIVGNAVIIGLEGLIVTIQVIRLQYYEFFSKFFTRTGKSFDPIRFEN
ncbi:MAG TPA: V-type ATPase 116kDa subunit family protein [Rectinemataceae bacterium]|nr:V-type ATPase 116kDa subunit family protein [Rectinemataceae bacterium]